MTRVELKKLDQLHTQAEALVTALVVKTSHTDFGSNEYYRLNSLVDKASTRAERRYRASMAAHLEATKKAPIPSDVSLGYVTVNGVVSHCLMGPGRELPSNFKEWVNPSLNR